MTTVADPPGSGSAPAQLPAQGQLGAAARPRPTPGRTANPAQTVIAIALALLSVLALWLVAFALWFSALAEHHDQHVLFAQLREQLAAQTAPVGGAVTPGAPVALLEGPHLGRLTVVSGSNSAQLRSGPGLLPGSVLPGQAGAAAILGRATTYGSPFENLGELKIGDTITTVTGAGQATFTVVGNQRSGAPLPTKYADATSGLTLTSGVRNSFLGVPSSGRTRVVYAVLKGTPTAADPVLGGSRSDQPMAWDSAQLYPLVLWLQLLLLTALGVAWVSVRGRRRFLGQMWVLAAPVAIAAMWGASAALFGVIPNLI